MTEVDPAPVATTGISPAHGSILITLQHDVGSIKQEIKDLRTTVDVGPIKQEIQDLRTMVESLIKEIKDSKRVKVEAVGASIFLFSFPSVYPDFASVFTRITVDPPRNRHFFSRSPVLSSVACDGTACKSNTFHPRCGILGPYEDRGEN